MVITNLQAEVAPDKVTILESTYKQAIEHLDTGIIQTYLLQSLRDAAVWQIVTVWESREVLEAMRQTGETPRGVLIFRAAGAEPTLSIFSVAAHAQVDQPPSSNIE
jgi:heme-degrading monooxygenase HmoA